MISRHRTLMVVLFLIVLTGTVSAQFSFDAVSLIMGETWTGNAYRQPYVDVTGSEAPPIDLSVGAGARMTLVRFGSIFAVTLEPRLLVGARQYLLYPNGWVVPTQIETATGATEDPNEAGIGSARVFTLGLSIPVGLEVGMGERVGLSLAFSPTTLYRIRGGQVAVQTEASELNPMYSFFYGNLRWLRPELQLALRVDLSDALGFTVRAASSISILDLATPTFPDLLPWWDQLQAGGSFELNLKPPFRGLFRDPDEDEGSEGALPGTATAPDE